MNKCIFTDPLLFSSYGYVWFKQDFLDKVGKTLPSEGLLCSLGLWNKNRMDLYYTAGNGKVTIIQDSFLGVSPILTFSIDSDPKDVLGLLRQKHDYLCNYVNRLIKNLIHYSLHPNDKRCTFSRDLSVYYHKDMLDKFRKICHNWRCEDATSLLAVIKEFDLVTLMRA